MTEKFTIYLGLNDQTTKQQEIATLDAYKLCVNIVGSCSINEMQGYYKHEDGSIVFEKSFKIEVFEKTEVEIKAIANDLKKAFNQECVIVEKTIVDSTFI